MTSVVAANTHEIRQIASGGHGMPSAPLLEQAQENGEEGPENRGALMRDWLCSWILDCTSHGAAVPGDAAPEIGNAGLLGALVLVVGLLVLEHDRHVQRDSRRHG